MFLTWQRNIQYNTIPHTVCTEIVVTLDNKAFIPVVKRQPALIDIIDIHQLELPLCR